MSRPKLRFKILLLLSLIPTTTLAQKPELVVQTGHAAEITQVVFSPDGRICATGDAAGAIKLWDARGGRLLRTIIAHSGRVGRLAFSADGAALASESRPGRSRAESFADETVKLWDVRTGKLFLKVELAPFAFSPDGRTFAAGDGKAIKLWDTRDGRLLRALAGHVRPLGALAFSPDGKLLGSNGDEGEAAPNQTVGRTTGTKRKAGDIQPPEDRARLWDVETGSLLFELHGCAAARFSPDGTLVADAAGNVCETNTGKLLHGHDGEFVSFSPDGASIVLWSSRGARAGSDRLRRDSDSLEVLDARSGKLIHRFADLKRSATVATVYSPEGRSFAVATGNDYFATRTDMNIEIWDAREWRLLYRRDGYRFHAFSPDGELLVAARHAGKGTITELLETRGGGVRAALGTNEHWYNKSDAIFSPDGRTLATPLGESLLFRDLPGGGLRHTFSGSDESVSALAFSPDGRRFAASRTQPDFERQRHELWETGGGSLTRTFMSEDTGEEGGGWINLDFVGFAPDGKLLATGDGRLRDAQNGAPVRGFAGFVVPGARANAVLSKGHVELQDAQSGRTLRRIPVPKGSGVALSPDGRLLAVSFNSGAKLRVYDAASGSLRRTFAHFEELGPVVVARMIFSPDSRLLAVTFAIGNAGYASALFDVHTGQTLKAADDSEAESGVFLTFSPDGKTFAMSRFSSAGRIVELREAPSRRLIRTITGATPLLAATAAFSSDGRILATGDGDTAVRFWSVETGELLATALSLPTGDWLAVTPDGLFDGSPAAWDKMIWRSPLNLLDYATVEAYFADFYHPGLLAEFFAGRRPKAPTDVAQKDRRQPTLKLALSGGQAAASGFSARTVTVKIDVSQAPAGARDVRLFRNGSLVRVWRGDVLKGQPSAILEASVPIVAGENRLTAYAFNRDNIKSLDATLALIGAAGLTRKGTAHVLAIGINEYSNPQYNLRYAVADAQDFAAEIKRHQERLGHYARVEITPLLNSDATKANILRALAELQAKAQPEDAVLVYFAGHGTAHRNSFYLLPHDLGYKGQPAALDEAGFKAILAHGVSDRELEQAFEKVDAGKFLLVIDACNSGQALEAEERRRGPMNSKGLAQLAYEKGMYVLTAAQSFQAAQEASQLGHGLLTYALVEEGLRKATADTEPKDGNIFVREWLDYAAGRVPDMQIEEMKRAMSRGLNLSFAEDERGLDVGRRSGQRPRVFYRRELEAQPLIVAKPGAEPPQK